VINLMSINASRVLICIVAISGLTTGCTSVRSDYVSPQIKAPAHWEGKTGSEANIADKWWTGFGDPTLDKLIEATLKSNNDLASTAIRVRRARLESRLVATNLTPNVSVGGNASTRRDLNGGQTNTSYGTTAELSYELDLWGKLAAARDASTWEALATEQDLQATALSLVSTTATLYWQIAFLNEQITTGQETVTYLEQILALARVRFDAGAASRLDIVQAEQSLVAQRVEQTQLEQSRKEARHAMGILFGESPQFRVAELQRLPSTTLPEINEGLPAELISRRPDMRASELRLREALANVDQSRASLYPSFTLTGSLGSVSTTLTSLLSNPVATLGVGLTLPFVQWNSKKLTIQVSETRYEEAVVGFRQSLYRALSEVENGLSARSQLTTQAGQFEQLVELSANAESLARVRYLAGKIGIQPWLDEQNRHRNAVIALAQNRLNRLNNLIGLYQALGGGTVLALSEDIGNEPSVKTMKE
jgi:NodT family efflux transporter outer membrane factor (OMF) lipoprotein